MKNRCSIKKIFGKSFHKNMSAEDIQGVWYSIPKEIREKSPELSVLINTGVMVENAVQDIAPKFEQAKKLLKTQEEMVLTAAATTAGNLTYAPQKVAEATVKKLMEEAVNKVKNQVDEMHNILSQKMKAIGACSEIDETEEKTSENKEKTHDSL